MALIMKVKHAPTCKKCCGWSFQKYNSPISSVTFPDLSVYFVQIEMVKLVTKRAKITLKGIQANNNN